MLVIIIIILLLSPQTFLQLSLQLSKLSENYEPIVYMAPFHSEVLEDAEKVKPSVFLLVGVRKGI